MVNHSWAARGCAAFVATIALVTTVGLPPAHADDTSTLAPVVASPPREDSPFTHPDAFCTSTSPRPPKGLRASARGVTQSRIAVEMLTPPGTAIAARTFGELVNRCAGILGRKLAIKVIPQTTDPGADCRRAFDRFDPFVVVSWAKFGGTSCVADAHQTVMIASGTETENDDLLTTQGRLAAGSTRDGVLKARVLDLIQSGRLDHKRIAVMAIAGDENDARTVRRLLAGADPTRGLVIVRSIDRPGGASADVAITTMFDSTIAQLAYRRPHPLTVYSLGDTSDAALDSVRIAAGTNAAKLLNNGELYSWMSPAAAEYRDGKAPTKFAAMCNKAYDTARATSTSTSLAPGPTTTTTVVPNLPDGPYQQVAEICLAWRITARALYNAGTNLTQRSLVQALYRLPNIDDATTSLKGRPNQVINEPAKRAGQTVFLGQAEYPCRHPHAPKDPTNVRMCWVPADGWAGGHAVNAPT